MHGFHHAFFTFTPLEQVLRIRIDAIRALNRVRHAQRNQRLFPPGQRTILKNSTIPVKELLRQRLIPVSNVAKPLQVFRIIIGFHVGNIGTLAADMEQKTMMVGVIGAGAMGAGIAQVAAQAGHSVVLTDSSDAALGRSEAQLAKVMARLVEKDKLTSDASAAIQSRIVRSTDLADLAPCGLVIEAIVEKLEVKQSVFQAVESHVAPDAILASNTSSLSITGIASALERPERFIGLHFFNPAPLLPLVEVIPALQTAEDLAERCAAWMADWGKDPVIAKDTPGFIVNRVARPFYGEALRILEEGIADVPTIDAAMKDQGFRMGPFELMDLIGNDVNYAVTTTVFEAFYQDPRYRPSLVQKRHVEAGWLGRKAGRGYYPYAEGTPPPVPSTDPYLREQVAERILAMLMNEAVDAVFMHIASQEDIEKAMTRGVNYPKGLLAWANEWGCDKAYSILENLRERYQEDRYRPSPLMRAHAASGTAIPLKA